MMFSIRMRLPTVSITSSVPVVSSAPTCPYSLTSGRTTSPIWAGG